MRPFTLEFSRCAVNSAACTAAAAAEARRQLPGPLGRGISTGVAHLAYTTSNHPDRVHYLSTHTRTHTHTHTHTLSLSLDTL